MSFTLEKKHVILITKIGLAVFYGLYLLAMLLGLFISNANITFTSRFYFLEALAFNAGAAWTYFHMFSLFAMTGLLTIYIIYLVTGKKTKLLKTISIYFFGAYLTFAGIAMFALGVTAGTQFDFLIIATLLFGISIWLSTLLEKTETIAKEDGSLIKAMGSLLYFVGIIISNQKILFSANAEPTAILYGVQNLFITKFFYPTLPDWIFGGLIWLFVSLYLGVEYLNSKGIITTTEKTKTILKSAIFATFTLELLLFSIFFIFFGSMQGVSVILMFIGSMVGLLTSIGLIFLLLDKWGLLPTPGKPKETPLPTEPTEEPLTLQE